MNSKEIFLAAAGAFVFSNAAHAADPIEPMVEPVIIESVSDDWTGLSIGVQAGIVHMNGVEDYDPDYTTPSDPYEEWDGTGLSLGVFAGYDVQVSDMFVLGVGGDINWNNASALEWPSFSGYDERVHHDWDASIYARAGFLASPDLLIYGLLGYGVGGFDASEYWGGYDDAEWTGGGVKVGMGVEAMVADGMFAKGEIAATFYDTHDIEDGGPYWQITPTVVTAKAGIGWKF